MSELPRVHVFGYADYRSLLRDLYAEKKAREYGFSHRAFSRRAGITSTNFLKLVMDGERNLSPTMAERFARGMGLTRGEADFFCELVRYDQANSSSERARVYDRLTRLRPKGAMRELAESQSAYYGKWYIPAIRELAARDDFEPDPAWIVNRLLPRITRQQASAALTTLKKLGLLVPDGSGRLRQAAAQITTGTRPQNHHLAEYHRSMITRARDAIDLFPRDEREIGSLTLCIDPELLPELQRKLQEFRHELMCFAEGKGERTRVVQVNFQLFPLTKKE